MTVVPYPATVYWRPLTRTPVTTPQQTPPSVTELLHDTRRGRPGAADELARQAASTPERQAWQRDCNLGTLLAGAAD